MLGNSKSLLVLAALMALPAEVHAQASTVPCNPNSGRAPSRIQCLTTITQLLSAQLASMKTELAQRASQSDLSEYAKSVDVDRSIMSVQSELAQYAKSSALDEYVKQSDFNNQLVTLKSELTPRPTWMDLTGNMSSSRLNPPMLGTALQRLDVSPAQQKVYEGRSSVDKRNAKSGHEGHDVAPGAPGAQGSIGTQSGQAPGGRIDASSPIE
jgi:hypothetical protein